MGPPPETLPDKDSPSASLPGELKRIAIIGTGLIGASFAAALKANGFSGHIAGCATSETTLSRAMELGYIDSGSTNAGEAVVGADLVMLAVPMMTLRPMLETIAPHIKAGCIITDAGSVKQTFIQDAQAVLGDLARVVPGHPIAGKEYSGVDAADLALYAGQLVILTPDSSTETSATSQVRQLWESCGARVEELDAGHHDRVLAATSHLPHVIAYGIVDLLAGHNAREEVFRYSAGGFRDFTRIASGDPVMWRDICLSNGPAISEILGELLEQLEKMRRLIDEGSAESMESIFRNAKITRDALIAKYDAELSAQLAARDVAEQSKP